jgi:hypothetical protein
MSLCSKTHTIHGTCYTMQSQLTIYTKATTAMQTTHIHLHKHDCVPVFVCVCKSITPPKLRPARIQKCAQQQQRCLVLCYRTVLYNAAACLARMLSVLLLLLCVLNCLLCACTKTPCSHCSHPSKSQFSLLFCMTHTQLCCIELCFELCCERAVYKHYCYCTTTVTAAATTLLSFACATTVAVVAQALLPLLRIEVQPHQYSSSSSSRCFTRTQ